MVQDHDLVRLQASGQQVVQHRTRDALALLVELVHRDDHPRARAGDEVRGQRSCCTHVVGPAVLRTTHLVEPVRDLSGFVALGQWQLGPVKPAEHVLDRGRAIRGVAVDPESVTSAGRFSQPCLGVFSMAQAPRRSWVSPFHVGSPLVGVGSSLQEERGVFHVLALLTGEAAFISKSHALSSSGSLHKGRGNRCPLICESNFATTVRNSQYYTISNGFVLVCACSLICATSKFQLTKFGAASAFPVSA